MLDVVVGRDDPRSRQRIRDLPCLIDRDVLAPAEEHWLENPGDDLPGRGWQVRQLGFASVIANPKLGWDEGREPPLHVDVVGKSPDRRISEIRLELGDID